MMPPQREFEKVPTDNFVTGTIDDYDYEEKHDFSFGKKFDDPKEQEKSIRPGIRFKFLIDGLKFPKHSKWMTFSYDERANLYKKYLASLVNGAKPHMKFDLDQLKKLPVRMLWKDDKNPDYQSLDSIRPIGEKVVPSDVLPVQETEEEVLPF